MPETSQPELSQFAPKKKSTDATVVEAAAVQVPSNRKTCSPPLP